MLQTVTPRRPPEGPILITGAAGFIGSHLVDALCARGRIVAGIDISSIADENTPSNHAKCSFHVIDIRDRAATESVFLRVRPEIVLHFAACAGVRASFQDPDRYASTNVDGTANVLAASASTGVGHVVVASSSSVYGDSSLPLFRECDPLGTPLSPYATTKVAMERLCREYVDRTGTPVTCLRLFSVFGPRQRSDLLIHRLVHAIECGTTIPLYGDGSSRRDYTHVTDVVAAVIAAIETRPIGFRVYNIGGGRSTSLAETVALVEDTTGRRARIERLPPQRGDIDQTWADISLAGRELGFAPQVELPLGIRQYVDWWRRSRGGA